jgi:hydrogenase expression/formation protein HypC
MCLAVPMKILAIHTPGRGTVSLEGNTCEVDLSLTPDADVDDYVIVHAGMAIEQLDRDEADARLALFSQLGDTWRQQGEGP